MSQLHVMIVSTSRADYGLLKPLIDNISKDNYFQLTFVVTGSHLIEDQGYTVDFIKNDGVKIDELVSLNLEKYSQRDSCMAIATGIPLFSEIIDKYKPDTIIILGDRYELFCITIPALIHNIPLTHIHGGEASFGAIDDYIRHSTTKLSSIHFASTEIYAKRIIQMGERPEHVFNVGAIGIDNIITKNIITIEELNKRTDLDFNKPTALMTYHPVTIQKAENSIQTTDNILKALFELNIQTLITMPNIDSGTEEIKQIINFYTIEKKNHFKIIKSLGQSFYLSAMKYARFMIGNSSSGIIESASFKLPVINIGMRQAGRIKPLNVIDSGISKEEIKSSIEKVFSEEFSKSLQNLVNPYGNGDTSHKIVNIIKSIDYKNDLLIKEFNDIPVKAFS